MIWLVLAAFSGMAVVGVSAWARSERRKVDAEGVQRREQARLQQEEAHLLNKLRAQRDETGGERQ